MVGGPGRWVLESRGNRTISPRSPEGTMRHSAHLPESFLQGGGGGIRTHGRCDPSTVFKTVPIDHSGTPPMRLDSMAWQRLTQ